VSENSGTNCSSQSQHGANGANGGYGRLVKTAGSVDVAAADSCWHLASSTICVGHVRVAPSATSSPLSRRATTISAATIASTTIIFIMGVTQLKVRSLIKVHGTSNKKERSSNENWYHLPTINAFDSDALRLKQRSTMTCRGRAKVNVSWVKGVQL